jgi:heptosyltransferase-1
VTEVSLTPESILVVRLGAIGDVLRVLPAVRRIRRGLPHTKIGWAIDRRAYPAVAGNPNVDRFHVLNREDLLAGPGPLLRELTRFTRELRRDPYAVSVDFHGRLRSGVVSRLSGAPIRIGYAARDATEGNHLFNNVRVKLADPAQNRVLRFLELLSPLGLDTRWDPSQPGTYAGAEFRNAAERWYEQAHRPEVVVYPGCSAGRLRERWPEKKWVDLLGRLGAAGLRSVVFWGPDERALCHRIVAAAGSFATMAPTTTLPEMMAMIGLFRAYIGSDTAATHMAWLQGVPTAVFIGPKDPVSAMPLDPVPYRVLRAAEFFRVGVRATHQSEEIISAVAVGEAFDAVDYLVQSGGREKRLHLHTEAS